MDLDREESLQRSPQRITRDIFQLTPELIAEVADVVVSNLSRLQKLDLHLREKGKIRRIENLIVVPNLRLLNLSYNVITKIEGLGRLHNLIELNLAENAIKVIENLENLKALERLNLSGNLIKRIPEDIKYLQRLTTLRLARNKLEVAEDIAYLGALQSLDKLRIDENPISELDTTYLFAVYCIKSLNSLDNATITEQDRRQAIRTFSGRSPSPPSPSRERSIQLSQQQEVATPTRSQYPTTYSSTTPNNNKTLTDIRATGTTPPIPTTPLQLLPTSTLSSSHRNTRSNHSATMESHTKEIAGQQIQQLNERIENLTNKLLASDREKIALKEQLEDEKQHISAQTENFALNTRAATKELEIVQKENEKIRKEMLDLRRSIEDNDHITTTTTAAAGTGTGSTSHPHYTLHQHQQQQQQQVAEIERLTTEVQHLHRELDHLKQENATLTDSNKATMHHCEGLHKTITELKNTLHEKERMISEQSLYHKYTSTSSAGYVSSWNINENKLQCEQQKTEIIELKQENLRLQRDLEQSIREITKLNDNILLKSKEIDSLKENLKFSNDNLYNIKVDFTEKESEIRRLIAKLKEIDTAKVTYEEECARLTTTLGIQQAEMEAYIRAHEATPRKVHFRTYSHNNATSTTAAATTNVPVSGLFSSPDRPVRGHRPTTAAASFLGDGIEVNSVSSGDEESEDSGAIHPGHLLTSAGPKKKAKSKSTGSEAMTSAVTNRDFYSKYTQPTKFSVTQLEIAAAEVIALVLMQEIEANMPKEEAVDRNNLNRSTSSYARTTATVVNISKAAYLKDACIRAALRVVHTSTAMSRQALQKQQEEDKQDTTVLQRGSSSENDGMDESKRSEHHYHNNTDSTTATTTPTKKKKLISTHLGRVEIHPFHALGDRELLSRIVAETHAGMAAIQDSDLVKQEIQHLETIVRELEAKCLGLDSAISGKEHTLHTLEKHCDTANSKSEETNKEITFLSERLQTIQNNIQHTTTEHQLLTREIELSRKTLQETLSMNEIEQNHLYTIRSKIVECKTELTEHEKMLLVCKENIIKENEKLRITKQTAIEEIRIIKVDLNNLIHNINTKQTNINELNNEYNQVCNHIQLKKQDSELILTNLYKNIEEENRKLSNLKASIHQYNINIEQLNNKKSILENSMIQLNENHQSDMNAHNQKEIEMNRKLKFYEKNNSNLEKKERELKSKISALHSEETILRHSVEEIQRQQSDLERALEIRRQTSEEEFAQTQHQVQVAVRAYRQYDSQIETKRAEYDNIQLNNRSIERRVEELKRQVREQEMVLETKRDNIKLLDIEHEKHQKHINIMKKEEEEIKNQMQVLRTTIDNDLRIQEELKRKLTLLKEEESSLKDSEIHMRTVLLQTKKSIDNTQIELNDICSLSERERRILDDLRTKKTVIESEINRLEDTLKFETERVNHEHLKRSELESVVNRSNEDKNRSLKSLQSIEKRIEDGIRKEDDLKRNETILKSNLEKLRLDIESLTSKQSNEKASVSSMKEELREIHLEIKRSKENLRISQQEVQTAQLGLETLHAQRDHLESLKDELTSEMNRIKESARQELQRVEKMEIAYNEAEQRLRSVRTDLISTEQAYEQMRNLTTEEEERVQAQRRALRQTLDELNKVEKAVTDGHRQVYEERQRALVEIGQLSQAKQSAQAHMFLAAEAQKRLDNRAALPTPHTNTLHTHTRSDPSSERKPATATALSIPDFLHSQNTSALYKATPTLATTGVKLNTLAPGSTNISKPNTNTGTSTTAAMAVESVLPSKPSSSRPSWDLRAELLAPPTVRTVGSNSSSSGALDGTSSTHRPSSNIRFDAPLRAPAVQSQLPSESPQLSALQRAVESLRAQSTGVMANLTAPATSSSVPI